LVASLGSYLPTHRLEWGSAAHQHDRDLVAHDMLLLLLPIDRNSSNGEKKSEWIRAAKTFENKTGTYVKKL
jgi:hypothetical protein